MNTNLYTWIGLVVVSLAFSGGRELQAADPTPMDEVVMYGIDGDTNELLRYTYDTDEYVVIGVITTDDGRTVEKCEALTFIPTGPDKGMYAIPALGSLAGLLLRINPLGAIAEVVADTGLLNVTGMVARYDSSAGGWKIIVGTTTKLLTMDPGTGSYVNLMNTLATYECLALTLDDKLLVFADDNLWEVDWTTGTETYIGKPDGYKKIEAMEFCFGDYAPEINIPGVTPAWTADGALMGFDDRENALVIINPATAEVIPIPCSFAAVDCEGVIIVTQRRDLYGTVVTDPHD